MSHSTEELFSCRFARSSPRKMRPSLAFIHSNTSMCTEESDYPALDSMTSSVASFGATLDELESKSACSVSSYASTRSSVALPANHVPLSAKKRTRSKSRSKSKMRKRSKSKSTKKRSKSRTKGDLKATAGCTPKLGAYHDDKYSSYSNPFVLETDKMAKGLKASSSSPQVYRLRDEVAVDTVTATVDMPDCGGDSKGVIIAAVDGSVNGVSGQNKERDFVFTDDSYPDPLFLDD